MPYDANKIEEEILKHWDKHDCFKKSVESRPENKPYHFYDGPPFATGLPHYGHIVASLMKDAVPRFWTMRGYRVERKWGWDCHGLPIENIIEKDLKLESKKDIEDYGVDKFNEACSATVLKYASEWKKTIRRIGRWVDMEADYKTMDISFMESVWWVFKELWNKGLIYQGHKAMHICPRCVTPLSNFEVTQNYKDVKDISVTVKFKIKDNDESKKFREYFDIPADKDVYILAWTTTPWTLPGNVLLAVNKDIDYTWEEFENETGVFIFAKEREVEVCKDKKVINRYEIQDSFKKLNSFFGSDLVGLEYEPLFPYFKETPNAFRVVAADFVTTTDGTGVVHIAPAFGEDDYNVGKAENVPLVQHVGMDGKFIPAVTDWAGQEVKPKDDPSKMDVEILKWLAKEGKLFSKEKVEHSYPHCWRCDTPLLNYATASWFVKVTEMKEQLLKNNQEINWVPEHIKEGRFGLWLEGARDWAISRSRFWGTPLPVWCHQTGISNSQFSISKQFPISNSPMSKCDQTIVIGSVEELQKLSGKKIDNLHKHKIDGLILKCEKCGGEMRRVPEVLDCWFESGSMPYGQMHYPFENKKKFEDGFPAEFIAEGQDQTRGWFYTLHVLATALTYGKHPSIKASPSGGSPEGRPAFKNVIVNGIVLAEDGKKMSKRLKNYPEPEIILDKYGADALRYYLASSPVMEAESLNFSEAGVRESYNKVVNTLWNVLEFYKMFVHCHPRENGDPVGKKIDSRFRGNDSANILDQWILAKLNVLIKDVTEGMEKYKLANASRPIEEFITELSQWFVRRSRDRFKSDDKTEKQNALATLEEVLVTLAKVMAPFTPFIAEKVYLEVGGEKESVHLEDWPQAGETDKEVLEEMNLARKVVELGLALRAEKSLKVKQPLNELTVSSKQLTVGDEIKQIIADELNVKKVELVNIEGLSRGKLGIPTCLSGRQALRREKIITKEDGGLKVGLDISITPELKQEGLAREIVRAINQLRKEMKLTVNDTVSVAYETASDELKEVINIHSEDIQKSTLSKVIKEGKGEKEVEIGEYKMKIGLKKE